MTVLFNEPIMPASAPARLTALRRLSNTNQYQEKGTFKHIAAMASRRFEVPIARVNIVEDVKVITLAGIGQAAGTEVTRGVSRYSFSILSDQVTIFAEAPKEPSLLANFLVHGAFGIEIYAAAPSKTQQAENIGAHCIIDKKPCTFSALDQRILENLASMVMDEQERDSGN